MTSQPAADGAGIQKLFAMPSSPAKPKILCLTYHNFDGPEFGAALRARHVCELLARLGDVRVVLAGDQYDAPTKAKKTVGGFELLDVVEFQPTPPWSLVERFRNEFDGRFLNTDHRQARAEDRQRLQTLMAAHDLVWVHSLKLANRFGLWHWPKSVLDMDDITSSIYRTSLQQAAHPLERFRHWRQALLWRRREKFLAGRFEAMCVCSEQDREQFGVVKNLFVVPNGFARPASVPVRHLPTPPRLGFVGTFNYEPNREGMRWFIEAVWPRVLEKIPDARLRLVGAGSDRENWRGARNLDALGFVADAAEEMATWSASIVPLFVGGGTRIKIAESFSRQCPVVSTSLGAYGYEVRDGDELWLADTPADFAEKCLRALTHPAEGRLLAGRAWEKFLRQWTWDAQAGHVAAAVNFVLKKS
jgi:glycosyltransferase involved in cell wall biosynthesis